MTAEVVTFGECLVSLLAATPGPLAESGSFDRHIAGAEANVAVGLARLGRSVAFLGRVGADGFGTAIVRRLRGEGVDVSRLTVDPDAPTGLMIRERRLLGPAQVLYARAGSAGSRITPDDLDTAAGAGLFRDARCLHLTGVTPALSESARATTERALDLAAATNLTISLDINLRRRLWSDVAAAAVLGPLAARATIVLGSPDELAVLTGRDAADDPATLVAAVAALGPTVVVAKLGDRGALGLARGGAPIHAPALRVAHVVDPVGAGDAFCAGFIDAHLRGEGLATALARANACGAAVVATSGDMAGLPDAIELDRLLAAGGHDTLR